MEADKAEVESRQVRVDEQRDGLVGAGEVGAFVAGWVCGQRVGHALEDGG